MKASSSNGKRQPKTTGRRKTKTKTVAKRKPSATKVNDGTGIRAKKAPLWTLNADDFVGDPIMQRKIWKAQRHRSDREAKKETLQYLRERIRHLEAKIERLQDEIFILEGRCLVMDDLTDNITV